MIYCIFGTNNYVAVRKIAEIKSAFFKKRNGAFSFFEFDGEENSFEKIAENLDSQMLFSSSRLVVLKNIFAAHPAAKDFLLKRVEEFKKTRDVFVFYEQVLDKKLISAFQQYAEKIQEAEFKSPAEIDKWILIEAKKRNIALSAQERKLLVEYAGEGAEWAIESALDKIVFGGSFEDVIMRKDAANEREIFRLIDEILQNKCSRALFVFQKARSLGFGAANMLRVFLWKFKTLAIVQNGGGRNLSSFVKQNSGAQARQFSRADTLDIWFNAIKLDSSMRRDQKNADYFFEQFLSSLINKS